MDNTQHSSHTIKERITTRDSNMELLRIVATLLILVVHANYFSQGSPQWECFTQNTYYSIWMVLCQSLSIVCVNLFVLISGWFGIKPRLKGFFNFIFQCLFYSTAIYITALLCEFSDLTIKGIAQVLYATKLGWFIKAYIGLYILSPVLNLFIEHSSKRVYEIVLIVFFIFQSTYGWLGNAYFFNEGYSTHSFIGLYLLARYIRIYKPRFSQLPKSIDLLTYIGISLIVTTLIVSLPIIGEGWGNLARVAKAIYNRHHYLFDYLAPTVIISSVALLLFFSKLNIQSKLIKECSLLLLCLLNSRKPQYHSLLYHRCSLLLCHLQPSSGYIIHWTDDSWHIPCFHSDWSDSYRCLELYFKESIKKVASEQCPTLITSRLLLPTKLITISGEIDS